MSGGSGGPHDRRMVTPRPWRSIVPWTVLAFVVTFPVAILFGLGGHIHKILAPSVEASGPYAGYVLSYLTDPHWGALATVARLVFISTVILAFSYAARVRRPRLDLIALVVWTVGFAYVIFSPVSFNAAPRACGPDDPGVPALGTCYIAWVPGWDRMALWAVVSAAILVTGYVLRRVRSAQKPIASTSATV